MYIYIGKVYRNMSYLFIDEDEETNFRIIPDASVQFCIRTQT